MRNKVTVHVVPSTHWDREWFLPYRQFQFRLAKLMDEVLQLLDKDEYKTFLLDGQTIMLEDYLEVRSEQRDKLYKHINAGKLIIGPWYVIPDLFLPSGESLIKNLRIGKALMNSYGTSHKVGYTPDSFGLNSQLPQIFKGFGMDGAIFTRGLKTQDGSYGSEFVWESPSGVSIDALHEFYFTGIFMSYSDLWKNMDKASVNIDKLKQEAANVLDRQNKEYNSNQRLWIVGVDHIEVKDNLTESIKILSEEYPDINFVHSSLEDYFKCRREENLEYDSIYGEQRGQESQTYDLGNSLSTRVDIKAMNRRCEDLLQYYCQPLEAYLKNNNISCFDVSGFIREAWRLLVQNHAHDSICTCSIDEVHKDIETRLRQVQQIAENIRDTQLKELGKSINFTRKFEGSAVIMLYNGSTRNYKGLVEGIVRVPLELEGEDFAVIDKNGIEPPGKLKLIAKKRHDMETMKMSDEQVISDMTRYPLGPYEREDMYTFLEVSFIAEEVPAQGYSCYEIIPRGMLCDGKKMEEEGIDVIEGGMENEFYKVLINRDGSLQIFNKSTGTWFNNQHYFEEEGDNGDEYTFMPLKGEKVRSTIGMTPEVEIVEQEGYRVTYKIHWQWELPCSIIDLQERSTEKDIVEIISEISLVKNSPQIDFKTIINNTVKDHRIRAVFSTPYEAAYSYSDTPFDLVKRPIYRKSQLQEGVLQTKPMRNVVFIPSKEGEGQLILSKDSCEYESLNEAGETKTAITLIRSVGRVMHCVNMPFGKGVRWWTEDSQMLKKTVLRYSLRLTENINENDILGCGVDHSVPIKITAINAVGDRPAEFSFLNLEQKEVVFSTAEKMSEKDRGSLIRLFNVNTDETKESRLTLPNNIKEAYEVRLDGERVNRLVVIDNNTVIFDIGSKEIKTIEVL